MATVYLGVLLLVLFFSGLIAWSKESEKNQDKWPRLSPTQRLEIVKQISPFNAAPGLFICAKEADDCVGLAVDLCDVVAGATNGRNVPIANMRHAVPSGIVITALPEDQRGLAIKAALQSVAGIKTHLEVPQDGIFSIFIVWSAKTPRPSSSAVEEAVLVVKSVQDRVRHNAA
jgi:hypothetical protein